MMFGEKGNTLGVLFHLAFLNGKKYNSFILSEYVKKERDLYK